MSAVWHHLRDPLLAAVELHRVVDRGGSVCLRGAFPDSGVDLDIGVLRAFPEARQVLDTSPTIADVGDCQPSPTECSVFRVSLGLSQLLRDDRVDLEGRGLLVGGPTYLVDHDGVEGSP